MLGYAAGGMPGALAGIGAGSAFNKAVGLGAYSVLKNSLMTTDTVNPVPVVHSDSTGVRVFHREFIQNISSTTAFTNTLFNVNPGLSATFPWLSNLAVNFEQYRFNGLIFYYRSTSADALNSTNTALGVVIMAADYNSSAPAFGSKVQMEQSMWCVSDKPACDQMAPIECSPAMNSSGVYYLRQGAVPSTASILNYDLCSFQVATAGSQAAAVVGELWVTYDVELIKPQLLYGAPSNSFSAHYTLSGITSALPLGTGNVAAYDNIGLVLSTSATSTITFPTFVGGRFLIAYEQIGNAAAVVAPAITYANCTGLLLSNSNTESVETMPVGGGGTSVKIVMYITVTVPISTTVSTITFGGAGTSTGGTPSGDLIVAQLNSAVV